DHLDVLRPLPAPGGWYAAALPAMLRIYEKNDPAYASRLAALCERNATLPPEIEVSAREVIGEVRTGGDAALRALSVRFDHRTLDAIELSARAWDELAAQVAPEVRA